jgi:hypothetical protein
MSQPPDIERHIFDEEDDGFETDDSYDERLFGLKDAPLKHWHGPKGCLPLEVSLGLVFILVLPFIAVVCTERYQFGQGHRTSFCSSKAV